ncbi:hypothetical protein CcrColossus_gp168 [Caulobacter phage CcrColossus]|uniref:Transmembrane protein n=1 Tax=Caulobacter phage CcrColossus TaxID=1211640 RepID=K4JVY9_9CAUD|nr:hypothetical protein CcrColossus_gp168 [Caulobacter phage CcrColossus]AFU88038.1 hypothetical protein CcrColossus_gp168 [Caulobacter phage CcrColossus]
MEETMRSMSQVAGEVRLNWNRFGGVIAGFLSWALVAALANLIGWWIVPALIVLVTYLFWDDAQALKRQPY